MTTVWSQEISDVRPDRYEVEYDIANPHRIHIRAEITLEDSILYMSPYGPQPHRWPEYIEGLKASHKELAEIPVAKRKDAPGWVLEKIWPGETIFLEYDMVLEHEALEWPGGIDGVAYRRDWGVMASGRSLFVMNGKRKRNVRVSFLKPDSWKVSAPWESFLGTEDAYRVSDLQELQESFMFMGTHRETELKRDGFTLKFVLGGPSILQQQSRFAQVASGVMDYYIRLMEGVPKIGREGQVKQSLVIISQSDSVDGEVIGNHISMFMDPDGEEFNQLMGWFMFAHEFFHLWNGKTLRFTTVNTDWFKEGVSNYYTMKALYQIGFANEEVLLAMLNNLFYQRYLHDSGYGVLPPYEAASGFDKDNHWGLIYGGGLFAGIAMDMEIRHNTENTASLDDLMRNFYKDFAGTDRTINQDDILAEANKLGTADFTDLMSDHVLGAQPISLTPYLKFAGIRAVTEGGQLQLIHIPEKTRLQEAIWDGFLGNQ